MIHHVHPVDLDAVPVQHPRLIGHILDELPFHLGRVLYLIHFPDVALQPVQDVHRAEHAPVFKRRLAVLRSLKYDAKKDPAAEAELCRVAETLFRRIPLSVVATTAARFIRTKDVHRSFCDRYEDMEGAGENYGKYHDGGYFDVHEWEPVESEHKEIGDTRYHAKRYRCIYCGRGWLEEESYRF